MLSLKINSDEELKLPITFFFLKDLAFKQGRAKGDLQLWVPKREFILVLLFITYCVFYMNICKHTISPPSIWGIKSWGHWLKLVAKCMDGSGQACLGCEVPSPYPGRVFPFPVGSFVGSQTFGWWMDVSVIQWGGVSRFHLAYAAESSQKEKN